MTRGKPMAAADGSSRAGRRMSRPSSLACYDCRSKHLKCDGQTPVCSRCSRQGLECTYIPSRRGFGGRAARAREAGATQISHLASPEDEDASISVVSTTAGTGNAREADACPSVNGLEKDRSERFNAAPANPRSMLGSVDVHSTKESNEQYLTNVFYSNFHPTHPFLVPRSRYASQAYPSFLRLIVQFVGSHFAPNFCNFMQLETIEATLENVQEPSTALVQSLLLFAIVLHSRNDREAALKVIDSAAALAIELGMHHASYASEHGAQDPLLEESLRRTWWELYVINGFFAALHGQTKFRCNTVKLGAFLPCDEQEYNGGTNVTQQATIEHMDQRFFALEHQHFSSGSYRIEAIRIIARVIAVISVGEDEADNIQAVDNAIVAWKYHLPHEEAGVIGRLGTFDHMMFQAHTFINFASILLHFSRSELLLNLPNITKIACSERMTQASPTSNHHAHKSVIASKALSDLAAVPADRYSPLFVCGLAFGCIVQLAVCSAHTRECVTQHRERVALMIGVLKCMSRDWPIADQMLQQLKRIASSVFNRGTLASLEVGPHSLDSGVDMNSTSDLGDWLDLFYPGDTNGNMWNTLFDPAT